MSLRASKTPSMSARWRKHQETMVDPLLWRPAQRYNGLFGAWGAIMGRRLNRKAEGDAKAPRPRPVAVSPRGGNYDPEMVTMARRRSILVLLSCVTLFVA